MGVYGANLAIRFASNQSAIRVRKNLRMCPDFQNIIKVLSK